MKLFGVFEKGNLEATIIAQNLNDAKRKLKKQAREVGFDITELEIRELK